MDPAAVRVPLSPDLADQHQVVGVGVKRGADQLVGDTGPVILRGIDVIDTQLDGLSKHVHGCPDVARWTPHTRPRQLHGAETNAADRPAGQVGRATGSIRSWTRGADIQHKAIEASTRGTLDVAGPHLPRTVS